MASGKDSNKPVGNSRLLANVFYFRNQTGSFGSIEANYPDEVPYGDITKIEQDIPDFDILLAGFLVRLFFRRKRLGFEDTRERFSLMWQGF